VIPWVKVSPGFERALKLLDRQRWLSTGLALAAVALGALALVVARRRGLALLVLGLVLAASAVLLRPLARERTSWLAAADTPDEAVAALAPVAVDAVLDGWTAVSGALTAIGLAIALVGLVLGVRRRRD
jgi:LPXTG-motif cell wall-anchored protein